MNFIAELVPSCDLQGLHESEFFNIRKLIKYMYVRKWCIAQNFTFI